jgi:glycosyltransferase involved in cell wall biosynthesis
MTPKTSPKNAIGGQFSENERPFLSVITVSFNAEATIVDTIASVDRQIINFRVEHVCVDGGSLDSTREVIDECVARGIPIKRVYEPDRGIFDAMNKGLRAASGEYVLFLNADDFLASDSTLACAMEGLVPGSAQNPDLIVGNVSMGNLGKFGFWRHRRVPKLLGRLRGFGLFPVHQGMISKRSLLDAVGGYNATLRLASDTVQFYDLERKFRLSIRVIGFDVAFMRAGGASSGSLRAMYLATTELHRHLRSTLSVWRATMIVTIKTLQSMMEIRLGRCRQDRWFAANSGNA